MKATDWKLGISTGSKTPEQFEKLAENGIQLVELSYPKTYYIDLDLKKQVSFAKSAGLEVWSYHLPFHFICPPFLLCDPSSLDKGRRELTFKEHSESIKKAGDAGIGIAVIHPSGEPYEDKDRPELIKNATDTFARLAEVASECGVTIAVENIPRTCIANCSDEMLQILSGDDRLRVVFDTNHLLKERAVDFISKVGKKIVTLHTSDYDFRNERHWFPGEGSINWVELVTALENVGYSGPLMYECGIYRQEDLIRTRDLTLADYKRVYTSIVNKLPIESVGKPILEKCIESGFYKQPII